MKDFSPPPSPTPTDFTDESDGDEMFLVSGHSFLFELIVKGVSAAEGGETQVRPRDGHRRKASAYNSKNSREHFHWTKNKKHSLSAGRLIKN